MKFWRIIPGEPPVRSTILGKFIRENYIAIGWNSVRDLTHVSEDDLEAVCREDLSELKESWISAAIRAFRDFRYKMREGDLVVVSGDGFVYATGKIVSPYYKVEEPPSLPDDVWNLGFYSFYHRRNVEWNKVIKFPFTNLPENIARKLGTPPTLVELTLDEWLSLTFALP